MAQVSASPVVRVATLAERPDLLAAAYDFPGAWPEFMYHDPLADLVYGHLADRYAAHYLVAEDPADPGRVVARALSLPVALGDVADLPDDGWDAAVLSGTGLQLSGGRPDMISALEITIQPAARGTGLSVVMLDAMRRNAAAHGLTDLVAPVRPNGKHTQPQVSMAEYAAATRPDGLPVDPWLRVHVRAGGRIVRVAPRSMRIIGSIEEWRAWTGLPFDATGPVLVPGALVPVHCDLAAGLATYVEPNVWVHHRLT
jgi:GNAT superfamily N-acetyltransferase